MKHFIYSTCILAFFLSCGNRTSKSNTGVISYDVLYCDSFDIFLHTEEPPYSYLDTLYTEMYIALKAMSRDHKSKNQCAQMVCDKVDELIRLDTIKENQIHYLDAKQIAQAMIKDLKGFTESAYRQYNLYPENSFERLGSLGSLFLATNKKDSAVYYLNKCIEISTKNLGSNDVETKEKGILGVIHGLVLLDRDQEAKEFLEEQLKQNDNEEILDYIHTFYDEFDSFKEEEWHSVKEFRL